MSERKRTRVAAAEKELRRVAFRYFKTAAMTHGLSGCPDVPRPVRLWTLKHLSASNKLRVAFQELTSALGHPIHI
jgi:hypothetical protein